MMQAIIIDGDGVVINRDKRFSDRLQADYGITTETTAPFFEGVFQKCVVGKADLKEELAHCYKNWGWKGTLKELLHYWFSKEGLHNEKMLQIIAKLRAHGISVFLSTDNEKYRTDYLKNEFGLGAHFDAVFSSAYIGFRKENVGFWKQVKRTLKNKPEEVLVWDDERENITAARNVDFIAEQFIGMDDFNRKMGIYFSEIL